MPHAQFTIISLIGLCLLFVLAMRCECGHNHGAGFEVQDKVQAKVKAFELSDVRLGDGPFKTAMEADAKWLLDLECDRLLSRFREYAGLEPKGEIYGGWESGGLSGHSLGHYLTACCLMYQANGNEEFLKRVNYIVDELEEVQKANGGEFISGLQECKRIFSEVQQGQIKSAGFDLNGGWAPWYTQHKLFNGLRDAYLLCGNQKAKTILAKLGDWAISVTENLTDEQFQDMMRCEYGGMNEAMADVYAVTGDEKYLKLARRFFDNVVLEPLTKRVDNLTGLHGNTQIPKLIGLERIYQLTGEESFHTGADFFWGTVVRERSYAIGGNTEGEYFHQKDKLSERLTDRTCETCNTYNMLKLTKQLFALNPTAEMADYTERAIYNHILASQNPEDGMTTYMMPLRYGSAKGFSDPFNSFWCCTGTGMENHAKYGEYIYFYDEQSLYVNLFMASELTWKERGLKVVQETRFPEQESSKLTIKAEKPVSLNLKIRHPYWATSGFQILVNGEAVKAESKPGSFVEISREWKDGDVVEVKMPMALRTEGFADNSNRVALMYGPIVLCAEAKPDSEPILIVSDMDKIPQALKPVEGKPLMFVGSDSVFQTVSGEKSAPVFKPLYAEYKNSFTVYWDAFNQTEWENIKEKYTAELAKTKVLEARTTDWIQLGEMQPERDHNLEAVRSAAGDFVNRKFRRADPRGFFAFDMKVDAEKPMEMLSIYSGTEQETGFGVMSEAQLKIAVQAARLRGEKVVMTNGCFDILHAGHVSYLANAGKLGDRLIVAVNTDESVRRLKGPGRPVNPTERRMAVLAALGAVDWVVPFAEDTPQRLIAEVLPDLLVKGGDYKPEEIAGYAEVTANGGEVRVLNFEDGCSTSDIIKTIRERG